MLKLARSVVERSRALVDDVRVKQEAELEENKDLFERSALRRIEARNKRQLSLKTSEYLHQSIAIMKSWLRDVMAVAAGTPELVINTDFLPQVRTAASGVSVSAAAGALRRMEEMEQALDYNVSPETCLDGMLFEMREVFDGSGSPCEPSL